MTATVIALNRTAEAINEMTSTNPNPNPFVIHSTKLEKFLRRLNGKIVTIDFHKKSGEIRTINGRLGVRKHVKGVRGWSMSRRTDVAYVTIYEMPKPNTGVEGGYRNVNLASVLSVRTKGLEYDVI